MLNNIDFRPNKLNFEWNENRHCFEHNYKDEYNIFVIWEKALESKDDIAKLILEKFEIVTIFKISWNESNINSNFKRLYRLSSDKEGEREAKLRGKGTFILYILKQTNPLYLYHTTYSGKVDIMNKDIINLKESIRSKLKDNLVHSSNNIQEFFRDATLFLGYERLQKVLKNEFLNAEYSISTDIAGSNGWVNFEDFFWTLNYSLNYVVLRNFEFLPNEFFENDKDVDILVDNQEEFLFLTNSSMPKIKKSGRTSCQVQIQKVNVSFDAITIGDNYYDYTWQCNILKNSTQVSNIQIPRKDDYFFSLLYHAKLQKAILKDNYIFLLKKNGCISSKSGITTLQ